MRNLNICAFIEGETYISDLYSGQNLYFFDFIQGETGLFLAKDMQTPSLKKSRFDFFGPNSSETFGHY